MLRKIYAFEKTIFSIGFLIGVIIACLLIKSENDSSIQTSCEIRDKALILYNEWFSRRKVKRQPVDYDILSYGSGKENVNLESSYLQNSVHIHCVVFVKKARNAIAIRDTWGRHCNNLILFSTENITEVSVIQFKPKSSWQYLCDTVRYLWRSYETDLHWVLFTYDDLYVIPENLRHYVAYLDYNKTHYLGNNIIFWGQLYNVGDAGYVLSKGAIKTLYSKFNSSDSCLKSGKYWKNDDFYLGKYLSELGIYPEDTKDNKGCARFHRHNLNYVRGSQFFKNSQEVSKHINVGCFSDYTITFNAMEADKFYLYYYLLNRVKVFSHGGYLGNYPPLMTISEDEVWKKFVREEGLENTDRISSKQYYELWERKIPSPEVLNAFLRQQSQDAFSSDGASGPGKKK